MLALILQRSLEALGAIIVISLLAFLGIFAIGNPVDVLVNPQANQIEIARATAAMGLDKPLWEQYLRFIWNALHGDLGRSFVFNQPSLQLIFERMPATLELSVAAMTIAVVVGLPLGIYAGMRPATKTAKLIMAGSIVSFSLPIFWVGLMLIMIFAVWLGWLPATGRGETVSLFGFRTSLLTIDGLKHIALPALNLALFKVALVIRLARAGTQEVMLTDYIRYARAKGLSPARIVFVHLLSNILVPIITVLGLEFGSIIAFAVVTESIFAWPGMGRLIISSISVLDRPVIVAYLMTTVLMFVLINLAVDILYAVLDPRVRLSGRRA
jgi:peptide/nickel transport system permease protein